MQHATADGGSDADAGGGRKYDGLHAPTARVNEGYHISGRIGKSNGSPSRSSQMACSASHSSFLSACGIDVHGSLAVRRCTPDSASRRSSFERPPATQSDNDEQTQG